MNGVYPEHEHIKNNSIMVKRFSYENCGLLRGKSTPLWSRYFPRSSWIILVLSGSSELVKIKERAKMPRKLKKSTSKWLKWLEYHCFFLPPTIDGGTPENVQTLPPQRVGVRRSFTIEIWPLRQAFIIDSIYNVYFARYSGSLALGLYIISQFRWM